MRRCLNRWPWKAGDRSWRGSSSIRNTWKNTCTWTRWAAWLQNPPSNACWRRSRPRPIKTFPPSPASARSANKRNPSRKPPPKRSSASSISKFALVCKRQLSLCLPGVILNPVRDDLRMMAPNAVAARDGAMKDNRVFWHIMFIGASNESHPYSLLFSCSVDCLLNAK